MTAVEWFYNTLLDLHLIRTDLKTTLKLVLDEAKQMELKFKENTYTEEQVREAIQKARHTYATSHDIIQSLKQNK